MGLHEIVQILWVTHILYVSWISSCSNF